MHKYEILDIIDQGAYGIVWKAVNKETQQIVAIKQFKQTDEEQTTKNTIQREIKMLKMLRSDYVVGIREAFKKKGKIYLIFEFFPLNLLDLIEIDSQGLHPKTIQFLVYKIVKCLKFLHNKNVIHRDIKPENILLNQNHDVLKLCDFGFARFIPENLREMTDYVATRWYRSPQLLVGEPYQKPSDIFALGCIIGQLVDGQPMFPGEDEIDQIYHLRRAIGDLTPRQKEYLSKNQKFEGVTFSEVKKKQTLEQRYLGRIQKNALLFMKSCLKMNADQRITADQALRHPFLIQLSRKYRDLQNDEQNLLQNARKTVAKHQLRSSIVSDIPDDNYQSNLIEDSVMSKTKSITKAQVQTLFKGNHGSVDYSNTNKYNNYSDYDSNQFLAKKSSQQIFTKDISPSKDTKQHKYKKVLKKNLSEEKNIKLNLDVNVNINLKFNKKLQAQNFLKEAVSKKILNREKDFSNGQKNDIKNNKLPELKPKGFMNRKKDDLLFGIGKRMGDRQLFNKIKEQLINKWTIKGNHKVPYQQKAAGSSYSVTLLFHLIEQNFFLNSFKTQ